VALVIADRVRETTTTTGTGTITLAGAVTNFETFTANLSNSDTTYYSIVDNTNGDFEVGLGTFTASGTTLARTTIIASSNSNSAVNFGSGTKDVFITIPASKMIVKDASGNVSIDGDVTIADGSNDFDVASHDGTNGLKLGGNIVTSSATELNILTGKSFVDEDNMASNSATAIPSQQSVKAYVDTQLTAEDLDVTTDSGTIDIDLDSETLTIAGGTGLSSSASSTTVTMAVDAAQTGITSVVNTSLEIGRDADNRIKFGTDNQIIFEVDGGDNVIFKTSGEIEATSLDISGDADIDGTLEADAITVNGDTLATVIAGTTVNNATLASTVTVSDSTANTNFPVVFHDESNGLLDDTGALRYNPSTGELLVPKLTVAGTTTTVDTVTMNAQNAIVFEGATADANETTLTITDPTADRTITLPDTTGTVALTSDIPSSGISSGNVATFTSGVADNDFLRVDGTSVEGRSASEVLSDIGGQASLTFGISNTNAVKIDSSSVADDEYARFTANGLESRSTSEVLSDIGGQASLTFGISNTNAVKIDSASVADDEFARFTANGLESRSASEVRSDIGLGTAATLAVGISNTNVAQFGSGVADNDFLRVDGTTIEGRSASELATDIGAATTDDIIALSIALG